MSERVDLVVRRMGSEWCLFTSDGTRKLGCHPTEKEAYAQEAAIKARQASAARYVRKDMRVADRAAAVAELASAIEESGGDEMVALAREFVRLDASGFIDRMGCSGVQKMWEGFGGSFTTCQAKANFSDDPDKFCGALKGAASECGIDVASREEPSVVRLGEIDVGGDLQTLENGDVVKWIPLAEPGEKWVNGPHEFDITPEFVEQAIKNFESRGRMPLPVTIGHVDVSGAPAAAWIEDIELRDDSPYGKVRFLKKTWDRIVEGEYKGFSLEFYQESKDGKGKDIGFEVVGGGIVNDPFFPIRIDQARRGGAHIFRLSRFMHHDGGPGRKESNVMTPEEQKAADKAAADKAAAEKQKLESVRIDGDRVTLSRDQYRELASVRDENQRLRGQLEEADRKAGSNESRIAALELSNRAGRIRAAVKTLQRDHRIVVPLGDFAMDSSDKECLEWLATTPMGVSTVEGLEKLARDQELTAHLPRIPGGKEVSGGSDRPIPVDLSTEAGVAEAVRRGVAQLKRDHTKEELALMLRRRGQSLEDFIRQELAIDNPEFKKVILAKN